MTTTTATKQSTGEEVAPNIPSGLNKRSNEIVGLYTVLTAVYAAIQYGFKDSDTVFGFAKPASEYCQETDGPCSRSDLFAFQVGSGFAICFCGVLGFQAWHISRRAHTALPQTPQGRLFGFLQESETLCAVNFTFQVWDFMISLIIPEHSGVLMLCHHVMAATVCCMALQHQVLHYYAVFFLGVTEFSSMFLLVVDLAKYFPPTEGTIYDTIVGVCGPLFAVAFTIYRVYLWWKVSFLLWNDCYQVVTSGISNKLRPGKNYVLYTFLVLNVPLSFLQLYWFTIILGEAQKLLVG